MNIVLCDPPKKETYYHANFPNLGLLYLVASLRNRFGETCEVLFLDGHRGLNDHLESLSAFRPHIYGISFAYFTRNLAYRVINQVKARFPDLPVICGGAMASAEPRDVLSHCAADICVRGEGEEAICDLVEFYSGKKTQLQDVPGIVFKNDRGDFIETSKRSPVPDIDLIPFPAWDLVDFTNYLGWHIHRAHPQAHLLVSRGCPYHCNYCSNPVWKYEKPWLRLRSPENIIEEIQHLYDLGIREIYLSADELNVNEPWALEVCRAIESLDFKDLYFNCNIRPDVITPELAGAFKRINLWLIHLGIESGNQRSLDGVGKGITLEQIERSCRILRDAGVKVFGFVMLYHAWEENGKLCWESTEDVIKTLDFCRQLLKRKLLDYISWQVATPMPGSKLWDLALKHGLLPGHEVMGVFTPNLKLPGVEDRKVKQMIRKGLWLKNAYMVRNGNINLRHLTAVWANLKVMLGLGPPPGAY
ncbi:B12-binding domain-containing radical SAM protein [Acidobacteriota bacterium]